MIELHITDEGIERTDYNKRGELRFKLTYTHMENIPSDVLTKLSVLRLLPEHSDIPEIGHKVSDNIYWIYEDGIGFESQFLVAHTVGTFLAAMRVAIRSRKTITEVFREYNIFIRKLQSRRLQNRRKA